MKKLMVVLVAMMMVTSAMAVAPLAQSAAPVEVGQLDGMAAVTLGMGDFREDLEISVRATYGAMDSLLVSLAVGYATDSEVIPLTLAAQYALALDIPVDMAVRVGLNLLSIEDMSETMAIDGALVISKQCEAVDGLVIYGAIGYIMPIGDLSDVADGGLEVAVGVTYDVPVEGMGVIVEVNMADMGPGLGDTMGVAVGATMAF